MDRIHELKTFTNVYKERCCANSYGIVVRRPYDPVLHRGEDVVMDPRDKQKWAERQIHWFIRQVSATVDFPWPEAHYSIIGRGCVYCGRDQTQLPYKD